MMCDKTRDEYRKCPVRKIIENALPHEVPYEDGECCRYCDLSLGIKDPID